MGLVSVMKAFVLEAFGQAAALSEVPRPICGDHEIVIRVIASSINPVDRLVGLGYFREMQPYRFPVVLGRDVSGVVDEIGSAVTGYAVGDRVWGFVKRDYSGDGTFAEYVACPADKFVTHTPSALSTEAAGVLGVAGCAAQACLGVAALGANDTVLITGAAGGAGTVAVQLASAQGARVLATGRPGAQSDLLTELGAQHVLDWTAGSLQSQVSALAPHGVDAVIELARPDARNAAADEPTRKRAFADFAHAVGTPGCRVASTTNAVDSSLFETQLARNVYSDPIPADLDRLSDAFLDGSVTPVISEAFDFEDIIAAFDCLDRSVTGKIALRIAAP